MEQIKAHLRKPIVRHLSLLLFVVLVVVVLGFSTFHYLQISDFQQRITGANNRGMSLEEQLASVSAQFNDLKNQDQVKVNQALQEEIKKINQTFTKSNTMYEKLLDLKVRNAKLDKKYDTQYALVLKLLAEKNYASAEAVLASLDKSFQEEEKKLAPPPAPSGTAPATATVSNIAPNSGYSRQKVQAGGGEFTIDIIAADLNSTRVIVDTASDSDCSNDCPVSSVGDYAARSGAFAAINGGFFCPATYPSCAGKTNSFDTLLMNKNKHYFNSDNNVYSTVPAVIFSGSSARFVSQSQQWGRDTGVDSVLANYPLYVLGGNNTFGGSSDPKIESRGSRTFIANKGNLVYIGIVYSASASEAAAVLQTLGMENALGLDQGGSTALWNQGRYIAGPGRQIPSAVLFVNK